MTVNRQTTVEPLLLSAVEAAKTLGISIRLLQSLNSSGRLPLPVRLGRRTLWAADELKAWLSARNPKTGLLPTRQQWIEIQENKK